MEVETSNWSGDGSFTQILIDWIRHLDEVVLFRVEDAPASRSEVGYNFISNELYVDFRVRHRLERARRLGIWPVTRSIPERVMTLGGLEGALAAVDGIGPPDYSDEGMIQYLRTERIIPPYQTKGYKLVELIRIYEVGTEPRR